MHANVTGTRVNDNLVMTLPADLAGNVIDEVRDLTLRQVQGSRLSAVIFECSAVSYMDLHEFEALRGIAQVISVLGARPFFAGLRPGIVKHLVLSEANLDEVQAFLGLNEVLAHLARATRTAVR